MTRKVLIGCAVTLAKPKGIITQALLCLFIFVVFLSAHTATFPYTHNSMDQIESAGLAAFLFTDCHCCRLSPSRV